MRISRSVAVRLALGSSLALSGGAAAQTTIKLADTMPAGHTIHRELTQVFIDTLGRESNGSMRVQHYPAGQLGKNVDALRLIQSGVQDVGLLAPSLVSHKMPLSSVVELPGMWSTACEIAHAMWPLLQEGGVLFEREYRPNNIRPLAIVSLPGYAIALSTTREIKGLKDLAGLRLRSAGAALDGLIGKLKASPVRLSAPELYEALSRGTVDGAIIGHQGTTSYKLDGLMKTMIDDFGFGTVANTYSISETKWRSTSPAARKALATAGHDATMKGCEGLDRAEADAIQTIKSAGAKFITLSPADKQELEIGFVDIHRAWAADLDQRGMNGTAVLAAFTESLKATRK